MQGIQDPGKQWVSRCLQGVEQSLTLLWETYACASSDCDSLAICRLGGNVALGWLKTSCLASTPAAT